MKVVQVYSFSSVTTYIRRSKLKYLYIWNLDMCSKLSNDLGKREPEQESWLISLILALYFSILLHSGDL